MMHKYEPKKGGKLVVKNTATIKEEDNYLQKKAKQELKKIKERNRGKEFVNIPTIRGYFEVEKK